MSTADEFREHIHNLRQAAAWTVNIGYRDRLTIIANAWAESLAAWEVSLAETAAQREAQAGVE